MTGSFDRDLIRRVGEHLSLGAVVLLLFQDPADADAFEAKLVARARAAGGRVKAACAPKVSTRGAPRPARPVHSAAAPSSPSLPTASHSARASRVERFLSPQEQNNGGSVS